MPTLATRRALMPRAARWAAWPALAAGTPTACRPRFATVTSPSFRTTSRSTPGMPSAPRRAANPAATSKSRARPLVLLIDNYDSFTYNLVQRLGEIDASIDVEVHRNDQISCDQIASKKPSHLIISPGTCTPTEAGISVECIQRFMGKLPILGVCLGHQSIGQATGGVIVRAKRLMHGKTDRIQHDNQGIFRGLPNPLTATRYHSLV